MDLLHPPSPQASLQSIGVVSDDLIYFSFNPNNAFSSISSYQTSTLIEEPVQMLESSANQENPVQHLPPFQPMSNKAQVSLEAEGDTHVFSMNEMFSEPYLLGMVLSEQLGDNRSIHNRTYLLRMVFGEQLVDNHCIHNLLATAVHAILLDSGFVLFDPVSGLRIDRFHLPDEWPSSSSFCYSLPQLLRVDDDEFSPHFTDYVVLKFQTLTNFFQVYGSLANGGSGLYRLSLDEYRFAPTLDFLWAHCLKNNTVTNHNDGHGSISSSTKDEVLKFWKIVKDGFALPLLIDLSYSSGLSLPACLMSLAPELKLKILNSLPAIDIARSACVCSEMRSVASDNELWKRKVEEEFVDRLGGMKSWKNIFHSCWENRKKRKCPETELEDEGYDTRFQVEMVS